MLKLFRTAAARPIMTSQPPKKRLRLDKQRKIKEKRFGSAEDVVQIDIENILGSETISRIKKSGQERIKKFEHLQEVHVDIVGLSSHGEGLGVTDDKDWIVVVPFCLPGERVKTKVYRNDTLHSYGDLVEILSTSPSTSKRDDSLVKCQYFGRCSGCQLQMLPYEEQLDHKRAIVTKAFTHLSGLSAEQLVEVQATIASPLQYAYRTKLTPHFEAPSVKLTPQERLDMLAIGFETKGRKKILDIEECPIATSTINAGMTQERLKVRENLAKYKRGATVLLRHSLKSFEDNAGSECISDSKQIVKENVAGYKFEFNAGSFFQNNNGILEALVGYVGEHIPPSEPEDPPQYLVDAYCGSGLFSICLSKRFAMVSGVEISEDSIRYARHNAELNAVTNTEFLAGKAEAIFESILFPPKQTTVLIDPPRKGCDEPFLTQLLAFGPKRILYVSCNVSTQARDVGFMVKSGHYKLDSLRGADLFPQTYHVEGVAVLLRCSP